jgi:hypothetical protein
MKVDFPELILPITARVKQPLMKGAANRFMVSDFHRSVI